MQNTLDLRRQKSIAEQNKNKILDKFKNLMQQNDYKPIKTGSLRYLRGITRTLMILMKTFKDVVNKKLEQREVQLALYDKFLKIYK